MRRSILLALALTACGHTVAYSVPLGRTASGIPEALRIGIATGVDEAKVGDAKHGVEWHGIEWDMNYASGYAAPLEVQVSRQLAVHLRQRGVGAEVVYLEDAQDPPVDLVMTFRLTKFRGMVERRGETQGGSRRDLIIAAAGALGGALGAAIAAGSTTGLQADESARVALGQVTFTGIEVRRRADNSLVWSGDVTGNAYALTSRGEPPDPFVIADLALRDAGEQIATQLEAALKTLREPSPATETNVEGTAASQRSTASTASEATLGLLKRGGFGPCSGKVGGLVQKNPLALEQEGPGALENAQILQVINTHLPDVQRCYEQELLKDHSLSGELRVRWVVELSGNVELAEETRNNLGSSTVADCVVDRVRAWQFPKPVGGKVTATFPFVFKRICFETTLPEEAPK